TLCPSAGLTGVNLFPLIVDSQDSNRLLIGGPVEVNQQTGQIISSGLFESTTAGATFVDLNATGGGQGRGTATPRDGTPVGAATLQGPVVLDPGFNPVTDKLSTTHAPNTIYVTDGIFPSMTKNRGVSWQTRIPAYNRLSQSGFTGGLSLVNVPQITAAGL